MTTLDVCIKLYEWFEGNDCFDCEKHFKKIFLISEEEEADRGLLRVALKKLESQGVISGIEVKEKSLYFLNKPLDSVDQSVEIDRSTALKIAKVINKFCEDIDDHKDVADPSKIRTKDILHLALIIEAWQKGEINKVD
jgi:hypothetical protein